MASPTPLYTIPMNQRPPGYGPWFSKVFFPIVFNLGIIGLNSTQFILLILLLIPFGIGKRLFRQSIDWTKDGFGRLLIAITVLFAPTSLVITTDSPPSIVGLVERDDTGKVTRINLPDRLVIMANHQAYTDWMYLWILACYSGHSRGITILLKASLRKIPFVGWGMRFFRFIFLNRSWVADKENLTQALNKLGQQAHSGVEDTVNNEDSRLLGHKSRSPLWLIIFPEGTITSDEERAKSVSYANKQGVDDFVGLLHPRSTGLLFCLRTLLPNVPDLKLLDVTIGYPGVPFGKYPQEWYGLSSVFFRSVPPPTVNIHLHLYTDLLSSSSAVPALRVTPLEQNDANSSNLAGIASISEARDFEIWLRKIWAEKDVRLQQFSEKRHFGSSKDEREVIPIRQIQISHWFSAFGGGITGVVAATLAFISNIVTV